MRWILLSAGLAACTTSMPEPAANGACPALEGQTFTSVDQLECGLGPNGVALCNWSITVSTRDAAASQLRWRHSDVVQTELVSCHGTDVTGMGNLAGSVGTYDPATTTLTWESERYTR